MNQDKKKAPSSGVLRAKDTRKVNQMSTSKNISPTGEDLRDSGQHIVEVNDSVEANAGAVIRATLDRLIESGEPFSADEIRDELEGNEVVERAMFKRPNLLPAIIGGASRKGLIEPIGIVKPTRPSRHANRNLIWRATKRQGMAA